MRFGVARRGALTILEVLIVVAIIGTLVGLLLPAIMAARDSSRCLQCKNNLREIGAAVQHFHDVAKRVPAAWTMAPDKASGYGWAVALLPYLEESNLGKRIDCRMPVAASQNEASRATDLAIMRCPSDISDPMFDLFAETGTGHDHHAIVQLSPNVSPGAFLVQLPAGNYLGVFGTLEADETVPAPLGDGAIVANRTVRLSDLERGQSHTILIGERTAAMAPSTWYGVDFHGEDAACRLVGSAISTPNCEPCDECEFGSRHSGGSNFVWADGHVSLVNKEIDPAEYQRFSKRQLN
jgi:prepilin-type processing-associated H-X9-DG protein